MIEPWQTPKPIPQIGPGRSEVDQLGERIAELSAQIQAGKPSR
jgi:hypothetical protein